MDNLTATQRKKCMTSIKSKDTKPELAVRRLVFKHGVRYRLNVTSLPGKPDIVLTKHKKAIFINGCFWHQHDGCNKKVLPKTNKTYWEPKLDKNVSNQKLNIQKLTKLGWHSYVVWECETKDIEKLNHYIDRMLI